MMVGQWLWGKYATQTILWFFIVVHELGIPYTRMTETGYVWVSQYPIYTKIYLYKWIQFRTWLPVHVFFLLWWNMTLYKYVNVYIYIIILYGLYDSQGIGCHGIWRVVPRIAGKPQTPEINWWIASLKRKSIWTGGTFNCLVGLFLGGPG